MIPFAGSSAQELIQWANAPIGEVVIPRYEEISGKRLMVDNTVAASTITIKSNLEMTKEEALEFIKGSLLLNGFAIIEKDAKTDVLINAAGKSPIGIRLDPRVYVDEADLPPGDRLVTYVMKFDYISPEDALRVFQVVARPAPYHTIAPVANVNAIVITDNVPLVRALIKLKAQIDIPGTGVTPESIPLLRADAQEVAANLNEILQAQSSSRSGSSSTRTNVVISPQGRTTAPGATTSAALDGNTIQIQAITRTNSILVIARPVDIAYVKSLIEIYDAPSQVENFLKRELKYIPVSDFLPVAENALSRYVDGGNSRSGGRSPTSSSRSSGGLTGATRNSTSSRTGTTGGFSGSRGGSSLGGSNLSNPDRISGPESLLVGNTLIIGDSQLNNVVVSGPPEHLRIIDQLLDEIDIRPRQVYINAVIAQVTLGDDIRFGKDLLRTVEQITVGGQVINLAGSFRTTAAGSSVLNVHRLAPLLADPANGPLNPLLNPVGIEGIPTPDGLGVWAQVGGIFNAYIQALEQTNRFQVISRPFVFTANNQLASISSGQRVAVPTQSVSSLDTGGNVSSSIGFEEVLLQLDVVPLINSKDEVTLTISQQNENITGFTTIGGNQVPDISTQKFETTVRLPNKAIVVLGGIIQEDQNELINGLPILSRIPGIKRLLGSTSKQKNRNELLIFLQPHIIETTDDLVEKNIMEIRNTIVGDKALSAARPDLELDSSLFPMKNEKKLFGRRKKEHDPNFEAPAPPVEEPALPEHAPVPPAKEKEKPARFGILKKLFNRDGKS
ncbi:MAG: secretin N-terminal domain-containing protein [Verrucomicrobiales bacterium]